mgnify:CR=1 FL=1
MRVILISNTNKATVNKVDGKYQIRGIPITVNGAIMNGILYTEEENSKGMPTMNGKPVVLSHPSTETGVNVSVFTPEGIDFYSGSKSKMPYLKDNVWYTDTDLDEKKLRAAENGDYFADRLEQGLPIGVSTGLLFEANNESGEGYNMIAKGIEFDHLAMLHESEQPAGGDATVMRFNGEDVKCIHVNELLPDENSQGEIYDKLRKAIKDKYPSDEYCWLPDVFETYFIYTTDDNIFYSQEFEKDDNGDVILIGEPKKVEKRWQTIVNALKRLNPFLHKDITKGYNVKDENINVNENEVPEMDKSEVEQLLQANNETQNKALADIVATAVNAAVEPLKTEIDLVKQSVTANADKEKADLVAKVNKLELGLPESAITAMNTDELNSVLAKHEGKPAGGVNTNSRNKPESDGLEAEMPE